MSKQDRKKNYLWNQVWCYLWHFVAGLKFFLRTNAESIFVTLLGA
ncbi:hypothetical protein OK016_06010 [Vibrio chagasii]|nr:hypothetical protein [Vibrio chagasii]